MEPEEIPGTLKLFVQSKLVFDRVDDVDIGDQTKSPVLPKPEITPVDEPKRFVTKFGYAVSPDSFVVTEPAAPDEPATCATSPTTRK